MWAPPFKTAHLERLLVGLQHLLQVGSLPVPCLCPASELVPGGRVVISSLDPGEEGPPQHPRGPQRELPLALQEISVKCCPRLLGMGQVGRRGPHPTPAPNQNHQQHKVSPRKSPSPSCLPLAEGRGASGRGPGIGLPQQEKEIFSGLRTKSSRLPLADCSGCSETRVQLSLSLLKIPHFPSLWNLFPASSLLPFHHKV